MPRRASHDDERVAGDLASSPRSGAQRRRCELNAAQMTIKEEAQLTGSEGLPIMKRLTQAGVAQW